MDELDSIWWHQDVMDDMRQKLQDTCFELEVVKMEASEQKRKQEEELNRLQELLKIAYKERDEARDQLTQLLNNLVPPESPLVAPTRANSGITESNSLSRTRGSSPADSFFNAVSSPEFSSHQMAFADQETFLHDCNDQVTEMLQTDVVMDDLIRGKTMPQRGNLLQAIMDAGPLLETLLVAGPLPQWRNPPPPPSQSSTIPRVSVQRFKASTCPGFTENSLPWGSTSQMCSASMVKSQISVAGINAQVPLGKRQRLH